jgi:competence protein ComEC
MAPKFSIKQWVLSHTVLLLILLLILHQFFGIINRNLSISVLDVGQGDSILIQTPEYKNILIDAGLSGKVVEELGKQFGFFNNTIDLFIITHPDRDHYAGILDVMQKYDIKQVMLTGIANPDSLYESFLQQILSKNTPIIFPHNNQDLQIGHNIYLDILYPFANQSLVGQEVKNKNNTSIVAHLSKPDNGSLILLTGDAEHELEREILLSGQDVRSPILKLGHHGAKTSTSDQFLKAVQPKTAIISADLDNKFGHPHPETMEKIADLEVFQTIDGTIEFNF